MENSTDSLAHLMGDNNRRGIASMGDENNRSYGSSSILKNSLDLACHVFDNVSCDQAEDLLRQHGQHGTYLIAHFHDPESYGLSIRLKEGHEVVYKHYAIAVTGSEFQAEGIPGTFVNLDDLVMTIGLKIMQTLTPIFTDSKDGHDLSITMNAEPPPKYSDADKFPQAARRPLPIIVPIHPTLRRMGLGRPQLDSQSGELPEEISGPLGDGQSPVDYSQKGCCWKAFHTDVNGKWWKPHKAGPITATILVLGWIIFLILFGWIVGLALILVMILICCAYIFNFICTGRCRVEESDEQSTAGTNGVTRAQAPNTSALGSGHNRTAHL